MHTADERPRFTNDQRNVFLLGVLQATLLFKLTARGQRFLFRNKGDTAAMTRGPTFAHQLSWKKANTQKHPRFNPLLKKSAKVPLTSSSSPASRIRSCAATSRTGLNERWVLTCHNMQPKRNATEDEKKKPVSGIFMLALGLPKRKMTFFRARNFLRVRRYRSKRTCEKSRGNGRFLGDMARAQNIGASLSRAPTCTTDCGTSTALLAFNASCALHVPPTDLSTI